MTWRIEQGDCLELLKGLPDASVDAVITDPPYGIGYTYINGREDHTSPEAYWEWLEPVVSHIIRVTKPGGFIAVWQAQKYFQHFWKWFGQDIHIYCAAKNFVQLRKIPFNFGYDPVVMQYKRGADLLRPIKPGRNLDYFVSNTAALVSKPDRIERQHPCPRPLDVVQTVIDNFVGPPGGTILDPFTGSGTTGLAAIKGGFSFIGFEKEQAYVDISRRRLEEASAQPRLEVA